MLPGPRGYSCAVRGDSDSQGIVSDAGSELPTDLSQVTRTMPDKMVTTPHITTVCCGPSV